MNQQKQDEVRERGAASIIVSLSGGVITVQHGTDKATLAQWTASGNDWDSLWERIRELVSQSQKG